MAVVHRGMHRPERRSAKHAKVRRYQGASVLQAMEEVCTESLQWNIICVESYLQVQVFRRQMCWKI